MKLRVIKLLFFCASVFFIALALPRVSLADSLITNINVGAYPFSIAINENTNKIYVVNRDSDSVSVIDGATNAVSATISVGSKPRHLAVNPNTNRIYVSNYDSNTVSVIDGATNSMIGTIAVGVNPTTIAINKSTNKIYISNEASNNVSIINGATNSVIATPSIGGLPFDIVINESANKVYVVNNTPPQSLVIIDGVSNAVIKNIVMTGGAFANFNKTTNKLYITAGLDNKVRIVNTVTETYLGDITIPAGAGLYRPAINESANKIYIADPFADAVFIIDGATDTYLTSINIGAGTDPRNTAYNLITNKIYVSTTNSNQLKVYDGANYSLVSSLAAGTYAFNIGINQTTSKIYVVNRLGNTVSVYDGSVTIPTPVITSINPTSGPIGTSVTITGANFGVTQGASTLKFNGVTATSITSWSDTQIIAVVPAGATTGNVTVITGGGASNGILYTVTVSGTGPILDLAGGVFFMAGDKNSNKIYALIDINTYKFAIIDHVAGTITYKNVAGFSAKDKVGMHFSVNSTTGKLYLPYSSSGSSMKKDIAIIDPVTFSVIQKIIFKSGADIRKIIVDEAGNRIFALDVLGRINVISGSTDKALKTIATSVGSPYYADDFEYDSVKNKIYTVGYAKTKKYLIVVDAAAYKKTKTILLPGVFNPGGRVFLDSVNAKVYVSFPPTATINGSVFVYNSATDLVAKTITLIGPLSDLAINSVGGKVYILSPYKIKIIDAVTLADINMIDLTDRAFFMAVNPQTNKFYVSQDSASAPLHDGTVYQLQVFSVNGGVIDSISFPYPVSSRLYDQCSPILVFGNKAYLPGTVAWQYRGVSPAPAYLLISD